MNASEHVQSKPEKNKILEKLRQEFQIERDLFCTDLFRKTLERVITQIKNHAIFENPKKWVLPLTFVPVVDVIKFITEVIDKKTLGGMHINTIREQAAHAAIAVLLALGHYAYFTGQDWTTVFEIRGIAALTYLQHFGADDANAVLASINNSYPKSRKVILAIRDVLRFIKHPFRVSNVKKQRQSRQETKLL